MVVASDSRVKNVAAFPTPAMNDMEMIITTNNNQNENKLTAKAVLICRQNSHPFQDRTLLLDEPVKVGRSVARARAKPNNAIFDCKVLSRNHAMLWYENGKFFLQDTKSSNGTFVNNNKLVPETEHHELSSGDIVQFGVDVVENNRKVTHGCIIATLKLYLPDGKEAKASASINENRQGMVPLDELYRLNKIIQEASDREECLQKKLEKLQSMLQTAKSATSTCWAAYVGEERLLSRIATLETQLAQATKNWTEDRCKQELSKIQDENVAYQVAAIEALEKLHSEKLEAVAYVTELEIKENAIQQEANLAKIQVDALQKELDDLLKKLMEEQKNSEELRVAYETRLQDLQAQLEEKNEELNVIEKKINNNTKCNIIEELEKSNLICAEDDVKAKKEMLENEEQEQTNIEDEQNHITLTVGPVQNEDIYCNSYSENEDSSLSNSDDTEILSCTQIESVLTSEELVNSNKDKQKNVKFDLPDDEEHKNSEPAETNNKDIEEEESSDDKEKLEDNVDSKTLKYRFQSNDSKKQIESLEQLCTVNQRKIEELEDLLKQEKNSLSKIQSDNEILRGELENFKDELKKTNEENNTLKNEVDALLLATKEIGAGDALCEKKLSEIGEIHENSNSNTTKTISYDKFVSVEEELVLLKERFSQVSDYNLRLQHDNKKIEEQYNSIRNQSHNMTFLYVAPLVLIVLYLLIGNMFS